jgi:hypothetical protein
MATDNQSPSVMKIVQCREENVRKITVSRMGLDPASKIRA